MGAKTCYLAYADEDAAAMLCGRPELDRVATQRLTTKLFDAPRLVADADSNLAEAYPLNDEIYAACFPGVSILSAKEFAMDKASMLPPHFLQTATGRFVYLHAMHSAVDWFAYAVWRDGKLVRSLSVSPDNGVVEDIGERRPFEAPF